MADRPSPPPRDPAGPDEPAFGWLYGGSDGRPDAGDDATQVVPVQPRDAGGGRRVTDPEPTQRLPPLDRPGAGGSGSRGPYQTPPPSRGRERQPGGPAGPSGPGGVRPVAPPPGASPSRRRGPRPRLRWLVYLVALWLVFLVVVPLLAWSKIDKVDASPSGDRPAAQPGTTYLLVGSDSREGLTRAQKRKLGTGSAAGRRTDTIMLLHTGAGPNLLMSIPRDSLVAIPGHGTTKVNAAYAFGGPKLLVKTLEQDTGIRIDDYVEIGFAGFVDVVDAVGGIQICPKTAMKDRRANLDIAKGCQDVDGRVALGYARSRHTSGLGDIARARHQREVVSAVGAKAVSPWTVLNPVRYYRLAMAGAGSLQVGEDTGALATGKFAYAMTRVNGKNGLTCTVPISDLAVHWDPERSKKLFRLIAEDRTSDVTRGLCRADGLAG